ncbi:BamA/TamA family outer membrane protein [candidate division KSB1 bacterium]|nr:BamA/TamA family outer membrane protein [candidate division KSB1 bacterium]
MKSYRQKWFIPFILIICFTEVVFAQFGYKEVDDDPIMEYQVIDFYSSSYYNRVEGIVLHGGIFLNKASFWPFITCLQGAVGTKYRNVQYDIGLQRWLFSASRRLLLNVNYFRQTVTNDDWKIGKVENSYAGLLLREDFYNHFTRRGWRIMADQSIIKHNIVRIEFSGYDYISMPVNTNFAGTLFGGHKNFRVNPEIPEGYENSVKLIFLLDSRNNLFFPTEGIYLEGILEKTFADFSTNGLFLKTCFFLPVIHENKFIITGMLGLRSGSTAPQHLISIGGIGSLRAYPDYYRQGQNFLFARVMYHFGGNIIKLLPLKKVPTIDATSLALFFECGDAWNLQNKKSLHDGITKADMNYDAGLSLLLADGIFRLDFARQIFKGYHNWRITFRLFNKL